MSDKPVVVVQGAKDAHDVPGLETKASEVALRFATSEPELSAALPGADVLLGWDFRADALRNAWAKASELRWIHWSGAGVDAVLFPELVHSEVVLTNSRGLFDRAMAEYVLGFIIAFAKSFPETFELQAKATWKYRLTEKIEGQKVLILGVGSIGREIARVLGAFGLEVSGIGRRARDEDSDFNAIGSPDELDARLPEADYVVIIVPRTSETENMFGAEQLRLMKPTARLINIARGAIVDEQALVAALEAGEIAGAALDVFETEPLPQSSPLWKMSNVIVSPHMSGDFIDHQAAIAQLFLRNLDCYQSGKPLHNVVAKDLGFVP